MMSSPQTRHPNPNPNPKTAAVSSPNLLTFDQVSRFFSLPLSDAADSLGVCTSVLKKICHDNGLVRWPYRKFVAGKSIEQIKEDAARAKQKQLNEVSKDAVRTSDALTNSIRPLVPGTVTQVQNKTTSLVPEVSKLQSVIPQIGSPQKLHGSVLTRGTSVEFDEFKYGFPSDGLSTVSYRWWGNSTTNVSKDRADDVSEDTRGNKESHTNTGDGNTIASTTNGQTDQYKTNESSIDALGEDQLSSLRKRAAKEGRDALKLGVHRRFAIDKLDQTKRSVLVQIFRSSLPSEWGDGSL